MSEKKPFEPLIKPRPKTTLKEKTVEIKDTMNFERRSQNQESSSPKADGKAGAFGEENSAPPKAPTGSAKEAGQGEKKSAKKEEDAHKKQRQATMKTQKMSLDVLLRLEILDPFLRSTENIAMDRKIPINEKVDLLIESYLQTKLSARQLEGFKAIYENYVSGE